MASRIGFQLANQGVEMFSGGAVGMDSAFENGYNRARRKSLCNIILPKNGFNGRTIDEDNTYLIKGYPRNILNACDKLISHVHSHYNELSGFSYWAHIRNCIQVLGHDLSTPVDEVFLWAPPNGIGVKGGTNTAFRIAQSYGIPCWNLAKSEHLYYAEERFGLKENNLDFLM
ncbi:MAG: hypothetical protein ACRC9Y_03200 [Aeromonas veronii]